ncbi:MAG: DUF4105 domain-containing protein [Bacteroidales bacterium]|nr:DUF4105 domain-containing protein [Candidatus Liminaster caballi]
MRRTILTLIVLLSVITTRAQMFFGDSLNISLLTAAPGVGAYERFGHTGIRVQDLKGGSDIVFHYGVYNYREPNFVWHFVEGICNYRMGANHASSFIEDYRERGLQLTEQRLWLDSAQVQAMIATLIDNYQPQNRNYRYNFFFDNCATRPYDLLTRFAMFDTAWIRPVTLRDMLQEKTNRNNWLDFGISLAIAGRADRQASFREQMFLPDYLMEALRHASIDGHPLVAAESELSPYAPAIAEEIENDCGGPFSPNVVCLIPMLFAWIMFLSKKLGRWTWASSRTTANVFDTLLLLVTGLTGCILWFLNFFSEHPAVDNNVNCLLFLATNVLFAPIISIKKAEKVCRIYFFIIFAAEILYIVFVLVCAQYFNPAFLPLMICMALRCYSRTFDR